MFKRLLTKLHSRKSSRQIIKNIAKTDSTIERVVTDISKAVPIINQNLMGISSTIGDFHQHIDLKLNSIDNSIKYSRNAITDQLFKIYNALPPLKIIRLLL